MIRSIATSVSADAIPLGSVGFQDPASKLALLCFNLHHSIMGVLTGVATLTSVLLFVTVVMYSSHAKSCKYFQEYASLEIMLTLIPSLFLFSLAVPSLASLYALEFSVIPSITIKVVGKQ